MTQDKKKTKVQLIDELRTSEERWRSYSENAPEHIVTLDTDFNIEFVNRPSPGLTIDELVGKPIVSFAPKHQQAMVQERLERAVSSRGSVRYETTYETPDGGEIFYESLAVPRIHDDKVVGLLLTARDITERKETDEALRESEERLRSITSTALDAIVMIDEEGRISFWNSAAETMFGYSEEEVRGKVHHTLLAPARYHEAMREGQAQFKETGLGPVLGKTLEVTALRRDGQEFPIELSVAPVQLREQHHAVGVIRDISARRRAEKELRESEKRFRNVVESSPMGIHLYDLDGENQLVFRGANRSADAILGVDCSQFVGKAIEEALPPLASTDVPEKSRRAAALGESSRWEQIDCQHGTISGAFEVYAFQTKPGSMACMFNDITERKKAEQTLVTAAKGVSSSIGESFFQDLVAHLAGALGADYALVAKLDGDEFSRAYTVAVCADGEITENFEYDLVGTPCENVSSQQACMYPAGAAKKFPRDPLLQEMAAEAFAGSALKDAAGRVIGFMGVLYRHPINDIDLVANTLDIFAVRGATELERLRMGELRQRLETAIEQAAEVVVITNAQAEIQYVNPAFNRLTGYTRDEVMGQNPRVLKSGQHDEAFYRRMWDTLTQGGVWRGHLINKRKDGTLFEEEATISPVRDGSGTITNYVAVKRDVTRETELEDQLRQAQKMEAIGTLAGGIAHDFNNLLQAMLGYVQLAQSEVSEDNPAFEFLQEVEGAGARAADLVRQILAFSRQSNQDLQPVRPQLIVKEVLKLLRASLPSTIEIRQAIDSNCGMVLADPTEVHQVLMNLCTNAYHAMRDQGGVLEVTLDETDLAVEQAARISGLHAGRHVRLTVRDTGHGMDKATAERAFDPYFTTKKADEGTGLGLATVLGIVKSSRGAITVDSEPGKGTAFEVFLPLAQRMAAFKREEGTNVVLPIGTEQLLFVDDDVTVADLGRKGLQRLGYRVEMRTSSREALEAFRHAPESFDAVITDQTMPHLTGIELAQEILRIRPDTPIILCTGFSELVDEATATASGILEYVHKPVLPVELARAIRRVLDLERRVTGRQSGRCPTHSWNLIQE